LIALSLLGRHHAVISASSVPPITAMPAAAILASSRQLVRYSEPALSGA